MLIELPALSPTPGDDRQEGGLFVNETWGLFISIASCYYGMDVLVHACHEEWRRSDTHTYVCMCVFRLLYWALVYGPTTVEDFWTPFMQIGNLRFFLSFSFICNYCKTTVNAFAEMLTTNVCIGCRL